MNRLKRILALAGVVLLLGMYLLTMIFALQKSEFAAAAFRGALGCTILVPVFLYMFQLLMKRVRPEKSKVIDAIVFRDAGVLREKDGSERYYRKEWENALWRKGYRLYHFTEKHTGLEDYLAAELKRENPQKVLYVDIDPLMIKRAQRAGLPALRFTDYPSALEEMEGLGIRL